MMTFRAALRVLALCAGIVVTSPAVVGQTIRYVDVNATGPAQDGASWCSAFPDLQSALALAQAGDEIRVAAGTYKPGATGNRFATFTLRSGVALRGGYAGCGDKEPHARDYSLYPAVLSGDLLGDDGANFANYADNSYHVVTYDNPAATGVLLEGFTISGGNANGNDALTNQGGAIHIRQGLVKCIPGGPTIRDCIVEKNWGAHHGAINDHGLSTVIENCIVRYNHSGAEGGGLQVHSGSPTIRNCQFLGNTSTGQGGGAWVGFDTDATCTGGSSAKFHNCVFEGNTADTGGGLYAKLTTSLLVKDAEFRGNFATGGAGVFLETVNNATFDACDFLNNEASSEGGGVYNNFGTNILYTDCLFKANEAITYAGALRNRSSNPLVTGCLFVDNYSGGNGGALHNRESSPTFDRCAFLGNRAALEAGASFNTVGSNVLFKNTAFSGNQSGRNGGALSNFEGSLPVLQNCTLYANTAARGGSAAANDTLCTTTFVNSIVWGHAGTYFNGPGAVVARYSIVQGGFPGVGNINLAPQFVDANGADDVLGTEDDDLSLTTGSAGINVGDPAFAPATNEQDLGGGPRLAGCRVDMGAQESDVPQTAADFNDDKSLDLADFANFQLCYLSPAQNPNWREACVCVFDSDHSGVVDLPDYSQLPWANGPCTGNDACDDGDACNGAELCVEGACQAGKPLDCDDADLCTDDACVDGSCLHAAIVCDDGESCTDDTCDTETGCTFTIDDSHSCSDGDACNGAEYCAAGFCHGGPALVCNDGNLCTDDACDPLLGCVYTPDDENTCDDGSICTGTETCSGGDCVRTGALTCADDNPCTDDLCDPLGGCLFVNNDQNACGDGDACNGDETCIAGNCVPGTPLTCDDENPCTDDGCEAAAGCVFTPNDANACDDSDVCTVGDACDAGSCLPGAQPDCAAYSTPCMMASCDSSAVAPNCDLLEPTPDGSACDDGDACSIGESCVAGECAGREPLGCSEWDTACAFASCDPLGAEGNCDTLTPKESGTACDTDSDQCTIDQCDGAGACVLVGTVECPGPSGVCDGGQACEPATGLCVETADAPAGAACEADGDLCTMEACDGAGACEFIGNTECEPPAGDCDAGESCDPLTGLCIELPDPLMATPCDLDGSSCSIDECDGTGSCVFISDVQCPGPSGECDGGQACDALTGLCAELPDAAAGTGCEADGDLCTHEVCDGAGGCVFDHDEDCSEPTGECDGGQFCDAETGFCVDHPDAAAGLSCESDGDLCTIELCDGFGACVFDHGTECAPALDICDGGQACDSLSGLCVDLPDAVAGTPCDADGDLCTLDACDGAGNCVLESQVQCSAPTNECDGGQVCEPLTGLCVDKPDLQAGRACDLDGNPCTEDRCNGVGVCIAGVMCPPPRICMPEGCVRP